MENKNTPSLLKRNSSLNFKNENEFDFYLQIIKLLILVSCYPYKLQNFKWERVKVHDMNINVHLQYKD